MTLNSSHPHERIMDNKRRQVLRLYACVYGLQPFGILQQNVDNALINTMSVIYLILNKLNFDPVNDIGCKENRRIFIQSVTAKMQRKVVLAWPSDRNGLALQDIRQGVRPPCQQVLSGGVKDPDLTASETKYRLAHYAI